MQNTNNSNCFDRIFENAATLGHVTYYADKEFGDIEIIKLVFINGCREFPLYIKVDADYDTIEIYDKYFIENASYRIFTPVLWSDFVGLDIIWVWEMKNQQGYIDGIQLEFREQKSIQFISIAGGLSTRIIIEKLRVNLFFDSN